MGKKVLVMGGSYFIGKKIVDILVSDSYEVYTLNRGTRENMDKRIINLKCDRDDEKQLREILAQYEFDIVVDVSGLDRMQVENLYKALNKKSLKQFVFISSSAVYDVENYNIPYKEETPLAENKHWTAYGENKIEAEEFLINELKDSKAKLVILRPPYVYGENNYAQRESFMFDHIVKDKPIIIPNDGNTYLQFIYTTDLANIVLNLIQRELDTVSIFNVGNRKAVTIKQWIEYCENVVGKKAKIIEYDYKKYKRKERDFFPFYNYDNVLEVSKINELYEEETDFEAGLKEAFNWYSDNKEEIIFKEDVATNEGEILKELGYM